MTVLTLTMVLFTLQAGEASAPEGVALPAVTVAGEPGLDCPAPAAVERALESDHEAAADHWSLTLERTARGVRITLRDPGGAPRLAREIAVAPPRCDSAADAVAIIIERYFRDVAFAAVAPPSPAPTSASPLAAPEATAPPPPAAPPAALSAPHPGPATPVSPAPARPFFSPVPRLVVGAGPALTSMAGLGPALALDARVRLTRSIWVGAATYLPPYSADVALGSPPGSARRVGVPVSLRAGAAGQRGSLALALGVEALISFEQGESLGIAAPATAMRTVVAAGVGLGAAYRLGARVRVGADLAGYRTVLGRSFAVGGLDGPVLDPPAWQAVLALKLELIALP